MNAPWKPGPLGNRDPFAAFICDEAALDVLRPVIIEMGWQPEKCNKGGLRNAVQSLSIAASPAIPWKKPAIISITAAKNAQPTAQALGSHS